jgi:uncharacterized protein (TIGR03032 family)
MKSDMKSSKKPQGSQDEVAKLTVEASRQWVSWQSEQLISLAFTTYQAGKVFFIGLKADGHLSVFERNFSRCMGLTVHEESIYLASQYQLWRLNNVIPGGQAMANGFDRCYVPNVAWVTGDVDTHDLGILKDGRPAFVNTLFSCIATVGEDCSFKPLWQPKFISKLVPEDRCHLNGMAMDDGVPRFATAVSTTDVHEGWREHRQTGGVVIDIESDEIVTDGLSMPHSPRWYRDQLWVLNSGEGEFGKIDLKTGKFEAVAFCPGYARGLAFYGDYAIIGLSRPRGASKTFQDLLLDQKLLEKKVSARCGLQVVDLRSGAVVHTLNVDGIVQELFDVAVLPGVRNPSLIGTKTDEIHRTLLVGDAEKLSFEK